MVSFLIAVTASTLGPLALLAQPGQLPVEDPHHHLVEVHARPWHRDLAPDARLMEIRRPASGGTDTVFSSDGRWRAFVVETTDEPGGRIRIEPVGSGPCYELRGLPLPYRPLSDLVWIDDHELAFDRWSQPHYGLHYVVDMRRRRLVLAAPFPDAFFLHQQDGAPDSASPRPEH